MSNANTALMAEAISCVDTEPYMATTSGSKAGSEAAARSAAAELTARPDFVNEFEFGFSVKSLIGAR